MEPRKPTRGVMALSGTTTAADFEAVRDADRHEYWRFYRNLKEGDDEFSVANPAFRLAPRYFRYYLERRPSHTATQALAFAFEMWDQLKGVSGDVREAFTQIDPDDQFCGDLAEVQETWRKVALGVRRSFGRDDRIRDGLDLLQRFAATTASPAVAAVMLREAAPWRKREGQDEMAREAYERILQLDTSQCAWYVEYQARGALYGYGNLEIGQPVPDFAEPDIDGNLVDINDHRGKVVLLDFWSTDCPSCFYEFSFLRESRKRYAEDRYSLIGVSLDQDAEKLRECAAKEGLDWPLICQGKDWDDPLALLFNVTSIPNTYIVDANGLIAGKAKRQEALLDALHCLLA